MNQPQQEIPLVRSADYREGYANNVEMRWQLWDFLFSFGTINRTAPDKAEIVNFQGVFLSPQQAKSLANMLNKGIQKYEETFGEIKLPSDVLVTGAGGGSAVQ